MSVADTVAPLVAAALGDRVPIRVTCWDGSTIGPSSAPLHVVVRNRRALRRIVWAPHELGFARAYVSGDLEVEGDLVGGLEALDRVADPERGPDSPPAAAGTQEKWSRSRSARPVGRLTRASADRIAAGAADAGDTVSAQVVPTTPEASLNDRTITVIGTRDTCLSSEATPLDTFVRPLAGLPRTRVWPELLLRAIVARSPGGRGG
jgi:hypothetical protein